MCARHRQHNQKAVVRHSGRVLGASLVGDICNGRSFVKAPPPDKSLVMDIALANLATFAVAAFLIELTPGPNMGWLALVSASEGRRAGLVAVAGIALGLLLIGLAGAAGLGAIIAQSPIAFGVLRAGGVLYLLWLAYDAWSSAPEVLEGADGTSSLARHFRRGFVLNALNPKAMVFFVTILPSFMILTEPLVAQAVGLTIFYVFIATFVHAMIAIFSSGAKRLLSNQKRLVMARRVMAGLLVVIAVWFAVASGR